MPVIVYFAVFHYVPMYGVLIAFKKFQALKGIVGSPWVGFDNFRHFFESVYFGRVIKNTVLLSLYSLLWGFPAPIAFALLLNELRERFFKRFVQTVSYLPHFISLVVVAGMIVTFTSPIDGVINAFLQWIGEKPVNFLNEPGWFRTVYIVSGVWQDFGWGSIIYLAALAGINPQLYEAAEVDGARRWHKMRYITLPGLLPTIVILFILQVGHLMDVGYEKILLLYSPATYETADVIGTFVYRSGIVGSQFSYAAAVGLFNNAINVVLLVTVNRISRKLTDTSLW
ncbi:ABC transporter permease [Paenibacillus cymbidii]|uniref:ABC transporter permease n=1 Tax=Paenibacillus cymbidii TaxID=1639034 RepID=UPI001F423831|nr:ABC transporter permease subunit [Paenibacillus cymbidii]